MCNIDRINELRTTDGESNGESWSGIRGVWAAFITFLRIYTLCRIQYKLYIK